jgi:Leucine-rich repeat (LRR) protein
MRYQIALSLFIILGPPTDAGQPDAAQVAEKIEKSGGRVTVDADIPGPAHLRVSFATLDDKSAAILKNSPHVVSLTVEDAAKVTDRTLAAIGTLSNLRELTLVRPGITNSGVAPLKGLKELRKLFLFDAKVTDTGVSTLKGLDHLEELDLSGTGITSGAAATFKMLSGLRLLGVSKTKFGDAGALQLKEMKELQELDAVNTDLSVKAAQALESAIPGLRIRR